MQRWRWPVFTHWSRRGKQGRGGGRGVRRSFSFDHGRGGGRLHLGGSSSRAITRNFDSLAFPRWDQSNEVEGPSQSSIHNPKYFKMLPNGDFDTEQYEDENDWEADMEDEETDPGKPPEKREAIAGGSQNMLEDGKQKKGRFESSGVPS